MSLDERPRGSTWPTPKVHYNSLPRTSIEGALAIGDEYVVNGRCIGSMNRLSQK